VNSLSRGLNLALSVILAALIMAKWSVFRMAQQINRSAAPGELVSLKWWPNYKDRRVMRLYRSVLPQGRWHMIYFGCLACALIVFLSAILLASHGGHQKRPRIIQRISHDSSRLPEVILN